MWPLGKSKLSSRPDRLELKIVSDPANLRQVRLAAEKFAKSAGLPTESSDAVGLAVNEALANVIRHGYDDATDKPIVVTLERGTSQVTVKIRDWGRKFDPASLPDPKRGMATEAAKLTPGGLGLLCISKMMDEVKYSPQPDGMLLTMVKRGVAGAKES